MMRKKNRKKGSMTVEMAILFPVVFFTILGILYICIVHYQNIVAGTAAMQAAARGAACWDKLGGPGAWISRPVTPLPRGGCWWLPITATTTPIAIFWIPSRKTG